MGASIGSGLGVPPRVCATKDWVFKIFDRSELGVCLTEIALGCQSVHPHIAQGVASFFGSMILVKTPRATSNMARWMSRGPGEASREIAIDHLLKATSYLHTLGVAHLDIKPENVLVYLSEGVETFKLTDFGSAKFIPDGECVVYSGPVVTSWWRPPEIWLAVPGETTYGFEVDVWSVGAVVYCLMSDRPPPYLEYLEYLGGRRFDPLGYLEYLSGCEFPRALEPFLDVDPTRRLPRLAFSERAASRGGRSDFVARFAGLGEDVVTYASTFPLGTEETEVAAVDVALMVKRGVRASEAILEEARRHFGGRWDPASHLHHIERLLETSIFKVGTRGPDFHEARPPVGSIFKVGTSRPTSTRPDPLQGPAIEQTIFYHA